MASPLFSGLSQVIAAIPPPSGRREDTPVEVTNLKALGSYNWVEDKIPTIAIPGRPAVWKDQPIPLRLREEMGEPFFDENIARNVGYPLEPDIIAIEVSQAADPDFNLSKENIDIVTNRNNLRKLISFANSGSGNVAGYRDEFRIDAQLALNGRTMILTRYETPLHKTQASGRQQNNRPARGNRPARNNGRAQGKPFIGFDHIFERMCTQVHPIIDAIDSSGSDISLRPVGYHRIVRYDLLGLRFLVHCRVDSMQSPPHSRLDPALETDIDSLSKALQETRLESDSKPVEVLQGEGAGVRYVKFGEHVPQDLLMDVKLTTGSVNWDNAYPQYFLSQTPTLRVATRTPGQPTVTELKTYDSDSLRTEHNLQAQRFRNLVSVLKRMGQALQAHGSDTQPLAFVWTMRGDMMVYKIEEKSKYVSDEGLGKF